MAYVGRYRYDIFVSYSHRDDPTWIDAFVRGLLQELRAKLGDEPAIWRDEHNIRLGQNWRDEIRDGIRETAVFITILSPGYQLSEWCARERKHFLEQFPNIEEMRVPLKVGSAYRFLKIVKAPWEDDEHLEFFGEAEHLEFFQRDALGIDREFVPGTEAYRTRLEEAAHHTATLLKAMRRTGEAVFVATPADDTTDACDELRNELRAQGYVVRPDGPLDRFYSDKAIKKEIEPTLLSVHLLGTRYDEFAARQVRLAVDLGKRVLFWMPKGAVESADARQRELLESIRNADGITSPFELFEGIAARKMIAEVLQSLKPQLTSQASAGSNGANIYLICDRSTPADSEFAERLREAIQPKEGLRVLLPDLNPPDGMTIEDAHQARLRVCDGVLLYRNAAPLPWLLQQAPGVLLAEQILQRPPFKAKAFLVDKVDVLPGFPNVLLRSPEVDLNVLEPFLASLRPSPGSHVGA